MSDDLGATRCLAPVVSGQTHIVMSEFSGEYQLMAKAADTSRPTASSVQRPPDMRIVGVRSPSIRTRAAYTWHGLSILGHNRIAPLTKGASPAPQPNFVSQILQDYPCTSTA